MFFFFNVPATTEIYTLSLHDALPISAGPHHRPCAGMPDNRTSLPPAAGPFHLRAAGPQEQSPLHAPTEDRKSTRLNSSHMSISYAVFCLKKKNITNTDHSITSQPRYI